MGLVTRCYQRLERSGTDTAVAGSASWSMAESASDSEAQLLERSSMAAFMLVAKPGVSSPRWTGGSYEPALAVASWQALAMTRFLMESTGRCWRGLMARWRPALRAQHLFSRCR